jgi:flagellar basal-body rod protein FlgB
VDLFDVTQKTLERALLGASLRERALANNVANANTPGFKRSDLDFHGALRSALGGGASSVERAEFAPERDLTTAARADGNNVDIDLEMAGLSETSLTYQALVSVAAARARMLGTAIGGRQ